MWLKLFFQVSRRTRLLVLLTFMGVRIWHWSDSWLLERKQQLFVFFLFFSWKFAFVVRKIQWSFCGIFVCCDFKVTKGMNEAVLKGNTRGRTGVLCPAPKEEEQSWTGEWLQKGQEGMPHGCWLGVKNWHMVRWTLSTWYTELTIWVLIKLTVPQLLQGELGAKIKAL